MSIVAVSDDNSQTSGPSRVFYGAGHVASAQAVTVPFPGL